MQSSSISERVDPENKWRWGRLNEKKKEEKGDQEGGESSQLVRSCR